MKVYINDKREEHENKISIFIFSVEIAYTELS